MIHTLPDQFSLCFLDNVVDHSLQIELFSLNFSHRKKLSELKFQPSKVCLNSIILRLILNVIDGLDFVIDQVFGDCLAVVNAGIVPENSKVFLLVIRLQHLHKFNRVFLLKVILLVKLEQFSILRRHPTHHCDLLLM